MHNNKFSKQKLSQQIASSGVDRHTTLNNELNKHPSRLIQLNARSPSSALIRHLWLLNLLPMAKGCRSGDDSASQLTDMSFRDPG
tara:strand:- start:369 stop:623 length:255 start_codon:yes stop_codon:yes gene_type:complete